MSLSEFAASTSFFEQGFYLSANMLKKNPTAPFKDHPDLTILADILSRQHRHHVILQPDFPANMYAAFLEAMLSSFSSEHIPARLSNAELLYLNLNAATLREQSIDTTLQLLNQHIQQSDNYILIALNAGKNNLDANHLMLSQIEIWAAHPNVRLLILNPHTELFAHQDDFVFLELAAPNEADILSLLKQQRLELEKFHQILIPEELLIQAYALAGRYLSTQATLAKTLLLLDSSAARTSATEQTNTNNQFKPALTLTILLQVLSSWTNIPIAYLQLNKFKLQEFTQGMLQHIFGQDISVHLLGQALQRSQANLQQHPGPFCSFLFAGPAHTGKKNDCACLCREIIQAIKRTLFPAPPRTQCN